MNMGKRGPGPQPETDQALRAFEDYWEMGDDRSLPRLGRQYLDRSRTGNAVPTKYLSTLKEWSSRWDWQGRCRVRITEEAERVRERERQRNEAFRRRIRSAIEADSARLIGRLHLAENELLTLTAADLERLTKLFLSLGGEPLAEKVQVDADVTSHNDCRARDVLADALARIAARISAGGGSGDADGPAGD